VDVAIAVDHLILAATALGLGTCWVCAFDAEHVKQALGLPANLEAHRFDSGWLSRQWTGTSKETKGLGGNRKLEWMEGIKENPGSCPGFVFTTVP